jgi:Cu/Ag efflux protein CusF
MKRKFSRLAILLAAMAVPLFAVPTTGYAEEEGGVVAQDTSAAVDVVVGIDKESRTITLKNEAGDEWVFTAGPEVRNFDQIKRGDLVLMAYYSAFAIALGPKGSGVKERASELKVERAKAGEKPGMRITSSIFVEAEVKAVDKENRTVTVQGPEKALAFEVSEEVDLSKIKAGQEVEALYIQSYAVAVVPAPKVSGTVKITSKSVAIGVGFEWGHGTLTMYDGTTHDFKVSGLSVVDLGVSSIEAEGDVYHLVEAKDLEGSFLSGEAGGAFIKGGSASAMKNEQGVVMKLNSTQEGIKLTLAGKGLTITLK